MITANNTNDRQVRLHYVQNVRHAFVLQRTTLFLFLNSFIAFFFKNNKNKQVKKESEQEAGGKKQF
jgi:hypothetical protein